MDHTGWLEFFPRGLATQLEETVERGTRVIKTDLLIKEHNLNSRQAKILRQLFEAGRLDIQDVERFCPNVTRRTLQRDMSMLEEIGLLKRSGETHQLEYVATTL